MERRAYSYCSVPLCENTSKNAPEKLFIPLPRKAEIRKKWLQLARRREPEELSILTSLHFCEDHFDLPNDMENYIRFKIMGSVKQIRMKPGCIPTKFECQTDQKRTLTSSCDTQYVVLKRHTIIEVESSCRMPEEGELSKSKKQDCLTELPNPSPENIPEKSTKENKAIQVFMKYSYRSKGTQTSTKKRSTGTFKHL